MTWARRTWVDDDGSLTVGTTFDAPKMNNIEEGIEEARAGGGVRVLWSTNIEATAPSAGGIKLNSATLNLATRIFISEKDAAGNSIAEWLATWASSTSSPKAYVMVVQENDPTKWALFSVVARTDNGEWDTMECAFVSGPGGFENGKAVRLQAYRTGDKGEAGTTATYHRDVFQREVSIPAATAIGSYILGNTALVAVGANTAVFGGLHLVKPSLYAVAGKKTRFKLIGHALGNATAAIANLKLQLRKVSAAAGAAGGITYTLSAAVISVETGSMPANAVKLLESGLVTIAEAEEGVYAMVVEVATAQTAASSFVALGGRLLVFNE